MLNTSIDYLLGFSNTKDSSFKKNSNLTRIQNKLESLGLLNENHELSHSQIILIEKLLDANKEFIEQVKNIPSNEA